MPFAALTKVVLEEFLFARPAYDEALDHGDGPGGARRDDDGGDAGPGVGPQWLLGAGH